MHRRSTFFVLSASMILIGSGIWHYSTAKDTTEAERKNTTATSSAPATGHSSSTSTSAVAASSPQSPANRAVRVRQLSGRAFAVEDFGRVPTGSVDKVIAELTPQAAAGDATASYGIFLKLNECANISRRASRGSALHAPEDVVAACGDLSVENEFSSSKWLALAAEQGNIGARLLYAADSESALGGRAELLRDPDRVKDHKQRAAGYLEEMVNQGSVDALLQLGNAYHAGVLIDEDPVTSRAYFEAVRIADPSVVPVQQVSTLDKALSAQQLSLAIRKGNQIHDSCCR